jgi:hypothetical protein
MRSAGVPCFLISAFWMRFSAALLNSVAGILRSPSICAGAKRTPAAA